MRPMGVLALAMAGVAALVAGAVFWPTVPSTAPKSASFRPSGDALIMETDTHTKIFLNADSVRGDRAHRQGWIISDFTADKAEKDGKRLEMMQANCDTTGFKIVSVVVYDREGETTHTWNEFPDRPTATQYPVPGSIGEGMVNAICDARYDPMPKRPKD